jgi:hypothetical protein
MKSTKHTEPPPTLTDAQLRRLIYSNWDFQQSLSALIFLMEECDFDAEYSRVDLRKFRCYETSVIVAFARPFEPSRGRTAVGLKAIGVSLSPEELSLQAKVLDLRRKVIAHSDEDEMHFRGTLLEPFEDTSPRMALFQFSESLHLDPGHMRPLESLLRKLMHAITRTLFQVAQTTPSRLETCKTPLSFKATS